LAGHVAVEQTARLERPGNISTNDGLSWSETGTLSAARCWFLPCKFGIGNGDMSLATTTEPGINQWEGSANQSFFSSFQLLPAVNELLPSVCSVGSVHLLQVERNGQRGLFNNQHKALLPI
jgi:hypothetical protein